MVSAWCQASWLFLRPAVYDDELVVPQSGHKAEEIRAVYSNPADGVIYAAGYLSSRINSPVTPCGFWNFTGANWGFSQYNNYTMALTKMTQKLEMPTYRG